MTSTLPSSRSFAWRRRLAVLALGTASLAGAQPAPVPAAPRGASSERGINEWLLRMQDASRRNYAGTFVVSSAAGAMSSARIWHVTDGSQQIERVEVLSGVPRSTFRRNDEVLTFLPERRVVRAERRESLGRFPNLLRTTETSIPEYYVARQVGDERVAGFDADVVQLAPKDQLRFGYRIWSEKRTGLVIKMQTLDADGGVLEQAAFSELQLDTPLRAAKLAHMMRTPPGWQVERAYTVKTDPAEEGWTLKAAVAGFNPMSCYKRPVDGFVEGAIHWIFSDGLASVSLFLEPYDRQRHQQEGVFATGATQTLTRRLDDWWLTVVGEVPAPTLKAFAQNLERRR